MCCFYPSITGSVRATVTKSARTMDSAIRHKGGTMVLQTDGWVWGVPGLRVLGEKQKMRQ